MGELSTLSKLLTTGLGLRREHIADTLGRSTTAEAEAQLVDLIGTLLANQLLDRPPALVPFARADLLLPLRCAAGDGCTAVGRGRAAPSRRRGPDGELARAVYSRSFGEAEFAGLWVEASQRLLRETLLTLAHSLAALPPSSTRRGSICCRVWLDYCCRAKRGETRP